MKISLSVSLTLLTTLVAGPACAATLTNEGVPQFDHQIVIMMENHGYDEIIGNPDAPYINYLANTYNLATNYFGTTHPSLPNYLDLIAGSNFGNGSPFDPNGFPDVNGGNDNPPAVSIGTIGAPTVATADCIPGSPTQNCDPMITSPSIIDQLTAMGLGWKTYQENLPTSVFAANSDTNGVNDKLYAVKHNPFMYFSSVAYNPQQRKNVVSTTQLTQDLQTGNLPNLSFIAPNQCNDMHGDTAAPSPCASYTDAQLIQQGDGYLKGLIGGIQSSSFWSQGNNVIYLLWDENDYGLDSNKVPMIAITNNGPFGIQDNTYYNHYSLLRTIEDGFGINTYLNNASTAQPMASLVSSEAVPEPQEYMGTVVAAALMGGWLLKRKRDTAKQTTFAPSKQAESVL